jgi:hypothetical protein
VASAAKAAPPRSARATDPRVCTHASRHGSYVSSTPLQRSRPAETVAGFLAAASIFVSLVGIAYRPLRLIPFAIVLALIAVAFGGRSERLATAAVVIGAISFALGLAVAVVTSNPLW